MDRLDRSRAQLAGQVSPCEFAVSRLSPRQETVFFCRETLTSLALHRQVAAWNEEGGFPLRILHRLSFASPSPLTHFSARDESDPTVHDGSLPKSKGIRASYLSWGRTLIPVLAIACLLLAVGCQATEQIRGIDSNPEAVTEIEEQSHDQNAALTLVTGDTRLVKNILVGADSVRWTHSHTADRHATPRTCVEHVQFERHDKGFLQGLGIGTGIGFASGGIAIAGLSAAGRCEGLAALACGLLGITLQTVGTVSGSIIGTVQGHDDNYVLQLTSRDECPYAGAPPENLTGKTDTGPIYR